MFDLNDVLRSSYFGTPSGYNNVDWFVDEVRKLENKMIFSFKKTLKKLLL